MSSVRTRLTVSLIVLSALVSLLGVFFGMRLLESQVRADALDEIVAAAVDPETGILYAESFFDSDFEDGDFFEPDFDSSTLDLSPEELSEFDELDAALAAALDEELEALFDEDPYLRLLNTELEEINRDPSLVLLADVDPPDGALSEREYLLLLRSLDNESALNALLTDRDVERLAEAFGPDDDELLVYLTGRTATSFRTVSGPEPVQFNGVVVTGENPQDGTPILVDTAFGFAEPRNRGFGDSNVEFAPNEDREYTFGTRTVSSVEVGLAADVTERVAALDEVRDTLRIAAVLLTVLAGVAAWLITGRALRPVAGITDQVSRISSGSLGDRVPVPSREDEIGRLARTMNAMLNRIEAGDRTRRQFVADASHELRTPVAVMQSEAEVALKAPATTTVPQLAEVMRVESARLGSMVEDLLSLARADEVASPDALQLIDVDEIVLQEARRTRAVPVDVAGVSAGRVKGRSTDVGRVITHLLDNAARHASSRVKVSLQTTGDTVVLHVDDDGNGLSTADRERVFERFVRLDEARTRDAGGAGLGLAVVQATVTSMHGAVVATAAPSGGARFTVTWPATDPG